VTVVVEVYVTAASGIRRLIAAPLAACTSLRLHVCLPLTTHSSVSNAVSIEPL
jgi:hypothetical protein